jgi:tRNA modification GTPase
MALELDDTIAALASPAGGAARGIVRVSGPAVFSVLQSIFEADGGDEWRRGRTARCHAGVLRLRGCRALLPALLYVWPTGRSYTGQPTVEIHTAGSPPLLEALLADLHAAGARPARAGEFTLRAFLSGRLDLAQAEAVLGVIDAADHRELETALRQLAGGLSGRIGTCRSDLLDLLADLEAGLDFVDEDIEFVGRADVVARLEHAQERIDGLLAQADGRMQSRGRRRVVLAGLPNAGKSTLFNALAGREAALVSEVRGTTRDYLAAELDWDGTAIELIDTAGWEHGGENIMQAAQALRREQLEQADLIVWCRAADLEDDGRALDERLLGELLAHQGHGVLIAETKGDLRKAAGHAGRETGAVRVAAPQRFGLEELRAAAGARLSDRQAGGSELLGSTAARCRDSLESSSNALHRAREAATAGEGDEVLAIEIREVLEHLGRIVGAVYTDDVLDRIFGRFCIGK